jgi:hypothetical protein
MISLNAYTGVATLYKPDLRHLPTTHNDLAQLHNNLMDEYGKLPGYVLYNNINHYNAIIQLDALTTGETPAEIPRIDQGKEHKRANITPNAETEEEKDMLTLDVASETNSDTDSEDDNSGETNKNNKVTETQLQNENITAGSAAVPTLVQATQQTDKMKTKRKTITSAGTGAGNSHRDIQLITIGNKQSHVEHIRRRCEAAVGKTVQEAMRMTVQNNKGEMVKYKQSDLKYDVNKKFLKINDPMQLTNIHTGKRKVDPNQPLIADEFRRKSKKKREE